MFKKVHTTVILFLLVSAFSVFALPAFATTDEPVEIIELLDEPEGTIDYQVGLREWYQIAADTIDIDVAELMESTDTIQVVAKANGSTARNVIKAIFAAEKAELKALSSDGEITTAQYRVRRDEIKREIQDFVRTDSYDPYTVPTIQEARWSELGLDTYTYQLRTICFCYGILDHTITVVDGEVVAVSGLDPDIISITIDPDGSVIETQGVVDVDPSGFRTMDEWFTYLADQQVRSPYYLGAQFDTTLGYPTSTYIDYERWMADDEIGYEITLIEQ